MASIVFCRGFGTDGGFEKPAGPSRRMDGSPGAESSLGNSAANDLVGLGRDWKRSDKVVRVEAGVPVVVYIRRDLTVE